MEKKYITPSIEVVEMRNTLLADPSMTFDPDDTTNKMGAKSASFDDEFEEDNFNY